MLSSLFELVYEIIEEEFGKIGLIIVKFHVKNRVVTIKKVLRELSRMYNIGRIKKTYITLIKHRILRIIKGNDVDEIEFDVNIALCSLCKPFIYEHINRKFGENASCIIDKIFINGACTLNEILLKKDDTYNINIFNKMKILLSNNLLGGFIHDAIEDLSYDCNKLNLQNLYYIIEKGKKSECFDDLFLCTNTTNLIQLLVEENLSKFIELQHNTDVANIFKAILSYARKHDINFNGGINFYIDELIEELKIYILDNDKIKKYLEYLTDPDICLIKLDSIGRYSVDMQDLLKELIKHVIGKYISERYGDDTLILYNLLLKTPNIDPKNMSENTLIPFNKVISNLNILIKDRIIQYSYSNDPRNKYFTYIYSVNFYESMSRVLYLCEKSLSHVINLRRKYMNNIKQICSKSQNLVNTSICTKNSFFALIASNHECCQSLLIEDRALAQHHYRCILMLEQIQTDLSQPILLLHYASSVFNHHTI